jgi:hypothetical protein
VLVEHAEDGHAHLAQLLLDLLFFGFFWCVGYLACWVLAIGRLVFGIFFVD